jgi:multidrug efflux pump subunit AcrA (membrane-fusion protein)
MEEEKKKKRGWVKDAAIIFLAVLLVLTFFSNTILNRSLPEVATVYVQEGTITSKVRGTGTVTARENYEVTIEQTRKVQSVLARVGDEVNVGDVLFTLQPGDSDELENAQKDLKNAERRYQDWLLDLTKADYSSYDRNIADARDALEEAREDLAKTEITEEELRKFEEKHAEIDAQIEKLKAQKEELAAKKEELEAEKAALEAQLPGLQAKIDAQQTVVDSSSESVDELDTRSGTLRELELQMRQLEEELHQKEVLIRERTDALAKAQEEAEAVRAEQQKAVDKAQDAYDEVDKEINEKFGNHQDVDHAPVEAAWDAYQDAKLRERDVEKELEVARVVYKDDYQDLVREASYLEYEAQASDILAAEEARYRTRRGLGPYEILTQEEQAEIMAEALPLMEKRLGSRDNYVASRLDLYLPAAAEKHAADAMGMAYQRIKAAEDDLTKAQDASDVAYEAYEKAKKEYEEKLSEDHEFGDLDRKRSRCKTLIERAQAAMDEAMAPLNAAVKEAEQALEQAKTEKTNIDNDISDLNFRINQINTGDLTDRKTWLDEEKQKLAEMKGDLEEAKSKIETLKSDIERAESDMERADSDIETTDAGHEKLDADLEARRDEVKRAQDNVKSKERTLEDEVRRLNQQKESDGKQQIRDSITQQDYLDEIDKCKARVEELSSSDNATEVRANVAGKVQELNVSAGHKAEANQVLATIEVPDLGYSMNFSVTTEQARRLKVGDSATVSNYYWGSQIVATLVSIQTDPQNPQGSRILNFDVTGDVTAGNSLTISIGERNANYDMVVPNSAVRSDTNGSFVLMITAKNSPLGNRYFATRVNVEVVASDEQYSAISGAIEAYDSVITTASRNAPIASGDQVRLADSNNG